MMSNKNLYRIALVAAILSAVCWVSYIVFSQRIAPPAEVDDPQQFFQAIQETRIAWLLYGWSGVLGTLLGIPYLLAFYTALKEKEPLVQIGLAFALIGTILATMGFFKPLTLIYEHLPLVTGADPEILPFLREALNLSLEVLELPWNVGSFLLFGLGSGLFAYHAWHAAIGPKWVNGIGIVGGLSGIVWLNAYLPFLAPVALYLIAVNILAIIIWSIGLSVSLVRHAPATLPERELSKRPLQAQA